MAEVVAGAGEGDVVSDGRDVAGGEQACRDLVGIGPVLDAAEHRNVLREDPEVGFPVRRQQRSVLRRKAVACRRRVVVDVPGALDDVGRQEGRAASALDGAADGRGG